MPATPYTLKLPSRLDVASATALREEWVHTPHNTDLELDASALDVISAAGMQLLVALARKQKSAGHRLILTHLSETKQAECKLLGFTAFIQEHSIHA